MSRPSIGDKERGSRGGRDAGREVRRVPEGGELPGVGVVAIAALRERGRYRGDKGKRAEIDSTIAVCLELCKNGRGEHLVGQLDTDSLAWNTLTWERRWYQSDIRDPYRTRSKKART